MAFGADHALAHPVEGGVYPHIESYVTNLGITKGDVMLLYCCNGYPGYEKEIPGIGIVIDIGKEDEKEVVYYQYFPLCHSISLSNAKVNIPELVDNTNFGFAGNWIRNISSISFRATISGHQIDWP